MKLVLRSLLTVAAAGVIIALFTPIGFPYRDHPTSPTKQRHVIHHASRTFHDIDGSIIREESGIYHLPFDYHGMNSLKNVVPALKQATKLECEYAPYCGFPYYFPMIMIVKNIYFTEGEPPSPEPRPKLTLFNRTILGDNVERLTFLLDGPVHSNIYVLVHPKSHLVNWSIGNQKPMPTATPLKHLRNDYFVYYSHGTKPKKPYSFWMDIVHEDGVDKTKGVVEIALGGHWLQGEYKMTPLLKNYVDAMPNWTFPLAWTATYENWIF